MFLRRRRSRRFADHLARRLGGVVEPAHVTLGPFETAHVMVAAVFEGMDLHLYVCVPRVHVEHRRFVCGAEPDLEMAVNAPRPALGLTVPVTGVAGGPGPVYVAREERRASAERFCRDEGCAQALEALALANGEWIVLTARQAWLRCRARDAEALAARLVALGRLEAEARRLRS